jgi:hypothetical protein
MVGLQLILFSKNNWRIFVPNIWWIYPRTYYTDLMPHWRHNKRDTYNEYIFNYYARPSTHSSFLRMKKKKNYLPFFQTIYQLGCGVAQIGCGVAQIGCGVAQIVARRLAVRQDRVRILARQVRGGPLPRRSNEDNKSGALRVYIYKYCMPARLM